MEPFVAQCYKPAGKTSEDQEMKNRAEAPHHPQECRGRLKEN